MGDIPLWLLIAAFIGWEGFAHFVGKNREEHTLSNRIWALEARFPIVRVVVASAVAVLFTHLVFQAP